MLRGLISVLQTLVLVMVFTATQAETSSLQKNSALPGHAAISKTRIVIKTGERQLYFYDSKNRVRKFKIAVGRLGMKWAGETTVTRKVLRPTWKPPQIVRKDKPHLPKVVPPGPNNPLGAAVLVLGNGTYGIHGTNRASSIGTAASYGCFRMHNKDILALYKEVRVGTKVIVMP